MSTKEWKKANHDKMLKYRRDWYARNKSKESKSVKDRRQVLVDWLKDYKSTLQCLRCSENHPACLDFHHRDSTDKEVTISQAIREKGWSKKRILAEIAKCDVLCANCHRKEHYNMAHSSIRN